MTLRYRPVAEQVEGLLVKGLPPRDAGGELRRQKPVVGRLDRQLPHRRDSDVDGDGPEPAGLQRDAPGAHGCLGEARPGLLREPGEKLVQPQVVNPFGDRGGNAIQDQGLQSAPVRRSVRNRYLIHFSPLNGPYR